MTPSEAIMKQRKMWQKTAVYGDVGRKIIPQPEAL